MEYRDLSYIPRLCLLSNAIVGDWLQNKEQCAHAVASLNILEWPAACWLKRYAQKGMAAAQPYDFLIVGAGITSAVFAHEAAKIGKTCLVIDRRDHIAGNLYTEKSMASTCISMVPIFSIRRFVPFGIT